MTRRNYRQIKVKCLTADNGLNKTIPLTENNLFQVTHMPKNVLVVDDSRMSRMMINTIIKTHYPDWTIIDAASGEEALEKSKGQSIDLMTLDMNMPGMDGITLGIELRKNFPDADIALVTANIQSAVQEKAAAANFIFVSKPITEDRILDFIKSTE